MSVVARETQTMTTADGVTISADHYHAPARSAAVVVCPGFFQSKDTATFQRMCGAIAKTCDVLAMDFRGHGRSGGLYTFSSREDADLEAVLAWAQPRYARLGILGFSMGGAIAINTLSHHPGVVCNLIAVSAPSSFGEIEFQFWTPEAMRTGLQGFEAGAGCRPGSVWLPKARPVDTIRQLQGLPMLFVHGTRDVIVGEPHSHRLFAAASEPKRLEIIEGGSHAEALFRDAPEAFISLTRGWWEETLLTDAR